MGKLLEKVKELSEKYKVLSSDVRLLILIIIAEKGEASWTDVKRRVEQELGHPANPNTLAFHLNKLAQAGLIRRVKAGHYVIAEEKRAFIQNVINSLNTSGS